MNRAKLITVALSVLTVLPIVAIALWSIQQTVGQLTDPCARWDTVEASLGPNDVCKSVSFHGSKLRLVTLSALVPGGLLAASLLGVAGAALSRRRIIQAGATGLLVETVVVFSIAPLTLAAGLVLIFLSRRVAPGVHSRTIMIP
jgi:hypothetical protein